MVLLDGFGAGLTCGNWGQVLGYCVQGMNVHMCAVYVGVVVHGCWGIACKCGVVLVVYVGDVGLGELPFGGGIYVVLGMFLFLFYLFRLLKVSFL